MSRRHHGRSHQGGRYRHDPARPAPGTTPAAPADPAAPVDAAAIEPRAAHDQAVPPAPLPRPQPLAQPQPIASPEARRDAPAQQNGHAHAQHGPGPANGQDRSNGCTAPQLRRFIKSRPYIPMHELRRRFAIDGGDDDVTQVTINHGHIYVGLPPREGSLLGELLRGGDIGYELSLDPRTPVVVGVYPMRPVPRS